VLQVQVLLKSLKKDGEMSKGALASIIVSALTTGFNSAIVSFDFDVDPRKRKDEPNFYGFVPDSAGKRTAIFICMTVNSTLLLLLRSVSTALFALLGGEFVALYYGIDMGLFLLYKVARRDFYHWIPVEGTMCVVGSILTRVMAKILTDFTGVVQLRGSADLGGIAWTVNLLMALIASLVATRVYYASASSDDWVMDEGAAWATVGGLSAGWASSFAAFLLLTKQEIRGTFYSFQTGYQYVQSKFLRAGDENKSKIFKYNKMQWMPIREDVKTWTMENWCRWEEEQPSWFTEKWVSKVDDDMIPPLFLRAMNMAAEKARRGSSRRRSSIGDFIGGNAGAGREAGGGAREPERGKGVAPVVG
jgi:hypothetical protein